MVILCLVPGLMMTVSCSKKVVRQEPTTTLRDENPLTTRTGPQEYNTSEGTSGTDGMAMGRETGYSGENIPGRNQFENEDIYFSYDSAGLTMEAQGILRTKADWLRKNQGVSIAIEGHCDERGTTEYNLALGDRRAEGVKAFLGDLGVESARMTTISYGEERPQDPGHSESAWSRNRRAHFIVK